MSVAIQKNGIGVTSNGWVFRKSKESRGQPGCGRKTVEPKRVNLKHRRQELVLAKRHRVNVYDWNNENSTTVYRRSDEDVVESLGFYTVETRCS